MHAILKACSSSHWSLGCPRLRTCSDGASYGEQLATLCKGVCCAQSGTLLKHVLLRRKVYGIIACQMVLTSIIAAVIMTHEPLQRFCATNVPFGIAMFIFPIAGETLPCFHAMQLLTVQSGSCALQHHSAPCLLSMSTNTPHHVLAGRAASPVSVPGQAPLEPCTARSLGRFLPHLSHTLFMQLKKADQISCLQTTGLSVSVGVACSFYPTFVVLEALALTSLIVVSLTVYTFRAVRKGADFSFMGPFLFTSYASGCTLCVFLLLFMVGLRVRSDFAACAGLMCLVAWSFMQFFFAPGPIAQTVFALFGAIVFSGYASVHCACVCMGWHKLVLTLAMMQVLDL